MRPLRLLAACLLLLAIPAAVHGQDLLELRGRLVDDLTGMPVASAVVRPPDELRYALSGEDGLFRLTRPAPGTHRLVVLALGYHDHYAELPVGGQPLLTLRLSPSPVELEGFVVSSGYLDDRLLGGSLDELAGHSLQSIHRVETYGERGERELRLYTEGYLRLVELGLVDPEFAIPVRDRYAPSWEPVEDERPPGWRPSRGT